jgi:hypothetical protein
MGRARRKPIFVPVALAVIASACTAPSSEPRDASQTATALPTGDDGTSSDSPWSSCYASFDPTGNPKHDIERLTRSCGRVGGMRPITEVQMGEQTERDPVDQFMFYVGAAGKCYRVYATSTTNVRDLDLLLRDPTGREVAADLTDDSWPVLPPKEPLCFQETGLYVLEVSVHRGAGRYALQVWGK